LLNYTSGSTENGHILFYRKENLECVGELLEATKIMRTKAVFGTLAHDYWTVI
jgi:hypothetical protein